VVAPTGNPGQRHLVHLPGAWWLLRPVNGGLWILGTADTAPGSSWTNVANFGFNIGTSGSMDGRSFGVDIQHFTGQSALHLSLSTATASQPLAHSRMLVPDSGSPLFGSIEPLNGSWLPVGAGDGAITSIGQDSKHTIADFDGLSAIPCATCAFVSPNGESGSGSWSFSATTTATSLGPTAARVWMRSAMALSKSAYVVWRTQGTLYLARQAEVFPWGPAHSIATSTGVSDAARSFATCAQLPYRGLVLSWTGSAFMFQSVADDLGGTVLPQSAPKIPPQGPPREMVLACGPNRVHAFAIFGATPGTSDAILGASWDSNLGWSPWVTVVAGNTTGMVRCFLTGFDRVAGASGDEVGIAWSEVSNCTTPSAEPTNIYAAFVKVTDS
jgi:hypothetical protein